MARLEWDQAGKKLYETGVSRAVLFPMNADGTYAQGVAWNGLTAVNEAPTGAEATKQYADNAVYLNLVSAEEFAATVEAFTYPDEFGACDGSAELEKGVTIGQQNRRAFAFCYTTIVGNDAVLNDYGYKIHIVYGAIAAPSAKNYTSVNDSPEATALSWEISSTPIQVLGHKPTATVVVDSTKVSATIMAQIEDKLYGNTTDEPTLLMPLDIATLVGAAG